MPSPCSIVSRQLKSARDVLFAHQRVEPAHAHVVNPADSRGEAAAESFDRSIAILERRRIAEEQATVGRDESLVARAGVLVGNDRTDHKARRPP